MRAKTWWNLTARVLLSVGLLYCLYLATTQAIARWYFQQPPPEGVRRAMEWAPLDPVYAAGLARVLERSTEEVDLDEVIRLYEKATQLSPHRARYWAELGGAQELAGRLEEAGQSYERAQQLFPNSPDINWKLGNFYLRQGRTTRVLEAFRQVLLGERALRHQTFDLAWRTGAKTDLIFEKMIPPDPEIHLQFLQYLTGRQSLDAADQAWSHLLALDVPFDPRDAFPYLDALIQNQQVEKLSTAWAQLAQRNPTQIRHRPFEPNLITNGDFESEILNGGLDWRVQPVEGVVVSVDRLTFFDGTHSLMIRFDGQHNLGYSQVMQYVPVQPNTLYRFLGYMRTQGITTDSGARFQIYDAYDPGQLSLTTENIVGTSSWSAQQLQFRTGPDTRMLGVRVIRPRSQKFDNQIGGIVWIDRLSLNPAE